MKCGLARVDTAIFDGETMVNEFSTVRRFVFFCLRLSKPSRVVEVAGEGVRMRSNS